MTNWDSSGFAVILDEMSKRGPDVCVNCGNPAAAHLDSACLFGPTTWSPATWEELRKHPRELLDVFRAG